MAKTMTYKEFQAQIMEAPRLVGDYVHRLPPGVALEVYPMDAFLKVPENWMKGQGVFVVPVRPNKGLWFNWRMNSEANTAVIPTVKGCNPITGLQTSGFHLEKYENKCPKHNVDFMADRFCPKCNYKWPDRNYVSMSPAWWDGFRSEDGTVRQFFFTEDELRDVATAMIGKENTVPAFGFAFYGPKERRPEITASSRYGSLKLMGSQSGLHSYGSSVDGGSIGMIANSGSGTWVNALNAGPAAVYFNNCSTSDTVKCSATPTAAGTTPTAASSKGGRISSPVKHLESYCSGSIKIKRSKNSIQSKSFSFVPDMELSKGAEISEDGLDMEPGKAPEIQERKEIKEVAVGAGAKIDQALPNDSYALDTWKDVPDAVMTIYFVFQEKFEELKAGGMRDFKEVENGMLAGIQEG